jgi:hypothetical protein
MSAVGHDSDPLPALLVRDVVRDVIVQFAGEELPVVDRLRQLDDTQALRLLTRRGRRRDLLGFGLDEVVTLASPVVWVVVNEAAKRFTNSAITGGAKVTSTGLRRLFGGRTRAVSVVPPLTREQLNDVRTQTVQTALRNGMDQQQANALADCVAGRLALGPQPESGQTPPDEDSAMQA